VLANGHAAILDSRSHAPEHGARYDRGMRKRRSRSIKAWPSNERPRERLLDGGADRLTDAELLAVLFPTAARGASNAVDQARAWLQHLGSLRGLVDAPVRALQATPGIGPARAAMAQAVGELARRYGQ
jgi:DNA repair protein RadC